MSCISHLFLVHMHYYLIHACYQTILWTSTSHSVALVVGRYFRTPSECSSSGLWLRKHPDGYKEITFSSSSTGSRKGSSPYRYRRASHITGHTVHKRCRATPIVSRATRKGSPHVRRWRGQGSASRARSGHRERRRQSPRSGCRSPARCRRSATAPSVPRPPYPPGERYAGVRGG